eukprot:TRINITY_DN1104_c0_g1_i3.p1 TRINITY_DN1104_c0_g1~~TRINITY_DN1104_c0_g1_i3.p1  ORF type:complete len:160 (+),score=27.52 TRINITY_DN1104_c0_g1_i3:635-1114(+)
MCKKRCPLVICKTFFSRELRTYLASPTENSITDLFDAKIRDSATSNFYRKNISQEFVSFFPASILIDNVTKSIQSAEANLEIALQFCLLACQTYSEGEALVMSLVQELCTQGILNSNEHHLKVALLFSRAIFPSDQKPSTSFPTYASWFQVTHRDQPEL